MYDPSARGLCAPDYPWARTEEEWAVELREVAEQWGDRDFLADRGRRYVPSTRRALHRLVCLVLAPEREPRRSRGVSSHDDGRRRPRRPAGVRCPTLVFHRTASREEVSDIASRIEGAKLVEVPGLVDGFSWANTGANAFMLDETVFAGGVDRPPIVDRVLATVLFTDIVGSTEASELGDEGWRRLLGRHHEAAARARAVSRP